MLGSRFVFTFGSLFVVLGSGFGAGFDVRAQATDAALLERVGQYVERYYERALTLLATETIVVQPLARDMLDEAYAWELVNEVRIEPDPADATHVMMIRELVRARRPALGPQEFGTCLESRLQAPDPLAFLLPARQGRYQYTIPRLDTTSSVQAQRVDYAPVTRQQPVVEWQGRCGNIRSPGGMRGSIWIDADTGSVLRLEARLPESVKIIGPLEPGRRTPRTFTLERHDTTIEYDRVRFTEPDETVLLPRRIASIQRVRNAGVPEVRVTRTFTDYRRFLTNGRAIID